MPNVPWHSDGLSRARARAVWGGGGGWGFVGKHQSLDLACGTVFMSSKFSESTRANSFRLSLILGAGD